MRARYYNPEIKRFINQDVLTGSITDSPSLNRYAYIQGNPISLADPFGLSPALNWNSLGHTILDLLGFIPVVGFVFDIANGIWYAAEGDGFMAFSSFVSALPGLGDVAGAGLKSMKFGTAACKVTKYAHVVGNAGKILEGTAVIGNVVNRNLEYYLYSDEKHKFDAGQFAIDFATVLLQGFAIKGGVNGLKYAEATSWCFVGETLIAYENGQKRIDEIEVGDKVWAYDTETGKTELKEVQIVYVHDCDEILHLHTSCGDIDTTSNHPFYVIGKGWITAGELESGDEVYRLDGSTAVVTGSELERLDEPIKVYNLEVEDYHTYFVGESSVLVHNDCMTNLM